MSRSPDLIMVVRHGSRLDVADPAWHLHSPTPYDSPLTYGGWNQTKLLGQRIAAILKSGKYAAGRNGRTSIGISAGIAEFSSDAAGSKADGAIPFSKDVLPSITEPQDENDSSEQLVGLPLIEKPLLRVDAFLGEWLSPDYFDHITPPPDTPLMLLSAKAELLAEAEEENISSPQQLPIGYFPGGWSGTGDSLTRQRSNSFSQGTATEANHHHPQMAFGSTTDVKMPTAHYNPPVPTSAISISDHIPHGYVAHARDTCMEVDMHWDSSKEPLDWGDGGQLGEEWGDLHRRFRRGLKSLGTWYKSHSNDVEWFPKDPLAEKDLLVVILVTHSSGCNALIGALTNQPALIDVGQASLTLATKKVGSDQYDVALKASTDHLRRKSQPKITLPKTTVPTGKKAESKPPPSVITTRHARSSSTALRTAQAMQIRSSSGDRQQSLSGGLWGQATGSGQPSPPRMWSIDKNATNQPMSQEIHAADVDSEAGASRTWSEQKAPAKRRWTTNEPTL